MEQATYRMTIADSKPTPSPETNRPPTSVETEEDAVWIITPIMKITHPIKIVNFLPIKSAQSPAMRAPKNVPADMMEVIRDWSGELMWKSAAGVSYGRPVKVWTVGQVSD